MRTGPHSCVTREFALRGEGSTAGSVANVPAPIGKIVVRRGFPQLVQRVDCATGIVQQQVPIDVSPGGCAIEDIVASPSGRWVVALRNSGQGEFGYDLLRVCPLQHVGGILEEAGYMFETPIFNRNETVLIAAFGERWMGGFWAHPDDEVEDPSRGGITKLGTLLVHHLSDHSVVRHLLQLDVPAGWIPDDLEDASWQSITQLYALDADAGVGMTLPGGARVEVQLSLQLLREPLHILLPMPSTNKRGLLGAPGPYVTCVDV
jgi:hypothetical protein